MELQTIGKWLILLGLSVILIGAVLWLLGRWSVPLGRLPGDIHVGGSRWSFHFPLVTCLILSVVLTVVLNLVIRWFR